MSTVVDDVDCSHTLSINVDEMYCGARMTDSDDFLNHNINRLMRDKTEWFGECIKRRLPKPSQSKFTDAEALIFATMRGRELTVSEIARLRGVSRQAIHRTVSGLVERGYLQLKPVDGSRRDKAVLITSAGHRERKKIGDVLREVEKEIAQKIGKERLEILRDILAADWTIKGDER